MVARLARDVVEDHLRLAREGKLDEDLARNYAPDVRLFLRAGIERGHDAARRWARALEEELPGAEFSYERVLVEGDVAFLAWSARAGELRVHDGADSFVVREGVIVAQTIHYTVSAPPGASRAR